MTAEATLFSAIEDQEREERAALAKKQSARRLEAMEIIRAKTSPFPIKRIFRASWTDAYVMETEDGRYFELDGATCDRLAIKVG